MKTIKMFGVFALLLVAGVFIAPVLAQSLRAVTDDGTSPGPAPSSGDGIPSGNQFIQPEVPGVGSAPNCGDGVSDGSGF